MVLTTLTPIVPELCVGLPSMIGLRQQMRRDQYQREERSMEQQ